MSVRSLGQVTARCGLVLAVLAAPLVLHRTLDAGVECPRTRNRVVACPDPHLSCPTQGACQGQGSVVENGPWDCEDNGALRTQCVTAMVPPGPGGLQFRPVCFTVYQCWLDLNGQCVPNTNVQGQEQRKVIKITEPCP